MQLWKNEIHEKELRNFVICSQFSYSGNKCHVVIQDSDKSSESNDCLAAADEIFQKKCLCPGHSYSDSESDSNSR